MSEPGAKGYWDIMISDSTLGACFCEKDPNNISVLGVPPTARGLLGTNLVDKQGFGGYSGGIQGGVSMSQLPTEGKFAKFWPFRVGITLLYGSLPGLERVTETRILLQTGQFAAELGIDARKLHGYLHDLHELMVITDLSIRHGHCVLTLIVPPAWQSATKSSEEPFFHPEEDY